MKKITLLLSCFLAAGVMFTACTPPVNVKESTADTALASDETGQSMQEISIAVKENGETATGEHKDEHHHDHEHDHHHDHDHDHDHDHHHHKSESSEKVVAYLATYELAAGEYKLTGGHTHAESLYFGFVASELQAARQSAAELMAGGFDKVENGDKINLHSDKLYRLELEHDETILKFIIKEPAKLTFFSNIAPGKLLPFNLEDAQGKEIAALATEILNNKADDIYNGYFEDADVKDRSLADWEGEWQSVYPYLLDGSLDEVMAAKAKKGDKSAEEYKQYYSIGYKTDVQEIEIEDNSMTFYQGGEKHKAEYKYEGYRILKYAKGNRGVRYLFTKIKGDAAAPGSVQFSDHAIAPQEASHFHIYFGDMTHEELLKEMDNWPTYYPEDMSKAEIVSEMSAH